MTSTVFDRIRRGTAMVAEEATHVTIDRDALERFAETIDLAADDDDPGHRRLESDEATAAFVMSLDAINFGSGYFPYIRKRTGHSGYHTVAAGLLDHIAVAGAPTTAWLSGVTTEECCRIFGQSPDEALPAELMGLFATALRELGRFIDEHGDGSFLAAIDGFENSAARAVEQLAEMPFYRDTHPYRDSHVDLHKRAQITPYDLAVTFDHTGPGRFEDIDQVTMFADNLVPHVLRTEGVLRFSPELIDRIDRVEDIPVGSTAEIEIRACALHAVELMVEVLRSGGRPVTAGELDGVLWRLGAAHRYKARRRHRTRCVFY